MKLVEKQVGGRPERILMTTDLSGGVWTFALELAQGLSRMGAHVTLAVMGGRPSRAARADARRIPGLELVESTYKLEWMRDPWTDVDAAGQWLTTLAKRVRPELVHLNGFAHGAVDFGVPVLITAHGCCVTRWDAVKNAPLPKELEVYRERVRLGLAGAERVIAPTQSFLTAFERHYGAVPKPSIVPQGRGVGVVGPAAQKESFAFIAGRLWDEAKNVTTLDAIAGDLPWPVYAAGDTQHPEEGTVQLNRVQALGRLHPKTVATWLSRAAVYVSPSRYTPFGVSTLEAALAGCALVVGDIPSMREVWQDAALYVAPDDKQGLRNALRELMGNTRLRQELSHRALARAQLYAGCRMLASYLQVYRELVGQTPPRLLRRDNPTPAVRVAS